MEYLILVDIYLRMHNEYIGNDKGNEIVIIPNGDVPINIPSYIYNARLQLYTYLLRLDLPTTYSPGNTMTTNIT